MYIEKIVSRMPLRLFVRSSFTSDTEIAWIVLPTHKIIIAGTANIRRLLKYRRRLKKKLIGTVSQKLACALIALSSSMLLKPIEVFVNLLWLTTFLKSFI